MRTTLRLDDDVLAAARTLAEKEGKTLGELISKLVRKGLDLELGDRPDTDFPVFTVPDNSTPITPEMVRKAADLD